MSVEPLPATTWISPRMCCIWRIWDSSRSRWSRWWLRRATTTHCGEEDLPKLFAEYDRLAAEMVRRHGTEKDFNFFHFMIDLEGGPCVAKRLSGCGSGTEYLAVTPTGDLYPCHQFVGNPDFLMGNVRDGVVRTDIRDEFKECNVYAKPKCRECFMRFYCSGGCAAMPTTSTATSTKLTMWDARSRKSGLSARL